MGAIPLPLPPPSTTTTTTHHLLRRLLRPFPLFNHHISLLSTATPPPYLLPLQTSTTSLPPFFTPPSLPFSTTPFLPHSLSSQNHVAFDNQTDADEDKVVDFDQNEVVDFDENEVVDFDENEVVGFDEDKIVVDIDEDKVVYFDQNKVANFDEDNVVVDFDENIVVGFDEDKVVVDIDEDKVVVDSDEDEDEGKKGGNDLKTNVLTISAEPPPNLSIKEKKELASYAHSLGKKLKSQQVGKSGVTQTVVTALLETLEKNELVKIKIHGNCPAELVDAVRQIEMGTGSVAVSQIGRTVILYRPSVTKLQAEQKKKLARRKLMKKNSVWIRSSPKIKEEMPKLSARGRRGSSRV